MSNADYPSVRERLAACLRVRDRLLHVCGVPLALGGIAAAAAAGSLGRTAVLLGAIVAVTGIVLVGWWVVSGLDRKLIAELQAEKRDLRARAELSAALAAASPELRGLLDQIHRKLEAIDTALAVGLRRDDGKMLDGLGRDVVSARDRTIEIAHVLPKLQNSTARLDASRLETEIARLAGELDEMSGSLREALDASKRTAEAALVRCRAALETERLMTEALRTLDAELGAISNGIAGGSLPSDEGTRMRERLATTIKTCDRLLQQAAA